MQGYGVEGLDVFKKAHRLTLELYEIASKLPQYEQFALGSQVRRASCSINSNLMEGSYRSGSKEFKQFASIARGSAGELKYQTMLMKDIGYIDNDTYTRLTQELNEIAKMLTGLIKTLDKKYENENKKTRKSQTYV